MKTFATLAVGISLFVCNPAFAQFTGKFDLHPSGCQDTGKCTLTYNLLFKDPKGVEWQADANDVTDGASIPLWAQPFVGTPFDPSYLKAAVIHDHYCDRHVRPWRQTHRAFYDAMISLGVAEGKAKLMYYAVYLGGPKWVELIPGKSCGTGKACINQFDIGDASIKTDKPVYFSRPADYTNPDFLKELATVQQLLSAQSASISLEDLEKRAVQKRPNDFYYEHGDKMTTGGGFVLE